MELHEFGIGNHGAGATLIAQQGTVQLDSNQGTSNSAAGSSLAVSVVGNSLRLRRVRL